MSVRSLCSEMRLPGILLGLLFVILAAPVVTAQGALKPSPLVRVSPEQLFGWAEANFSSLFPAGAATRTLADSGGLIYYRQYAGTGNNVGLQGDNILGQGNFTNGQVQLLGRLSDYACQILPNMCVFGSTSAARYLRWDTLTTPDRFCSVVQYQGAVYCGAYRHNGTAWTAVSAAPPSLNRLPTGRSYISQSGTSGSVYVDVDNGATLRNTQGYWGWDGGNTAVRYASGSQYIERTENGGTSWSSLTSYRIGTMSDNSSRLPTMLAYAHGSIVAVIAHYPPADISVDYYYLLVSPDGGQTWFESAQIPRVRDLYLTSAAQGYVATDQGVYALRFTNGIVLESIPFEGGSKPEITRIYAVGTARDTIFVNSSFSGFYLLNAITGTFYQPTPAWSQISYLTYIDNGANGTIVVGRGSTTYSTAYPLVLQAEP